MASYICYLLVGEIVLVKVGILGYVKGRLSAHEIHLTIFVGKSIFLINLRRSVVATEVAGLQNLSPLCTAYCVRLIAAYTRSAIDEAEHYCDPPRVFNPH